MQKIEFRAHSPHVRPAHPNIPANTQTEAADAFTRVLQEGAQKYAAPVAMPSPTPEVMPRHVPLWSRAWQAVCNGTLAALLCGAAFLLPEDDAEEGRIKRRPVTTGDLMRARAQRLHSWAIVVGMGPVLIAALVVGALGRDHSPRTLGLETFLCVAAVICLGIGFAMDNRAGRIAREAWGKK